MVESTVTVKGQTTLPNMVRDSLDVRAGDRVYYIIADDGVLIMPVRPTKRLYGSLPYGGSPVSLESMEDAIVEGALNG